MNFSLHNIIATRRCTHLIKFNYNLLKCTASTSGEANAPVSQAVFLETPVIAVPDKNIDLIGPPNPISNLRPIIRRGSILETSSQKRLRELQDETQAWNEEFWSKHNSKFLKERNNYVKRHVTNGNSTLTADEMSEFYKSFLDRNWHIHVWYNYEWYKKNFRLLFLGLRVNFQLYFSR